PRPRRNPLPRQPPHHITQLPLLVGERVPRHAAILVRRLATFRLELARGDAARGGGPRARSPRRSTLELDDPRERDDPHARPLPPDSALARDRRRAHR